ncbi:MAG: ATP cone domain-containing protein [Gemmatimonadota bacterium]
MATIVDGKKRIPFMRGMLVHYLIERGFDPDEAYELADQVRDQVRQKKSVSRKEVLAVIGALLQQRHNGRAVGDLVFWERRPTTIRVDRSGGTRPFSKELLSHSIQASGLQPDQAYEVASAVEATLMDRRRAVVQHEEIEELVEGLLAEHHGKAFAERYAVWRAWGRLSKPLAILIAGASGVGKTTLAISLANLLDIPRVVATDDIRQIMRLTLAPKFMPSIHTSSYSAWSSVQQTSAGAGVDPLIAGFREQARVVNVGVQAILTRCVRENTSVIIDGVHLLPEYIDLTGIEDAVFVVPMCLALEDRAAYAERFTRRAKVAPARGSDRYLAHMDDILKIQEHILRLHGERDLPVIDTNAVEDVTSAAVMVVVETLQDREEVVRAMEGNGKKGKKKK